MALEKPFIVSKTAEGTPDPVNFNDVLTFKKRNEPDIGRSTKPSFYIDFIRDENSSSPRVISWTYKDKCKRNDEYDKIKCLICKTIA